MEELTRARLITAETARLMKNAGIPVSDRIKDVKINPRPRKRLGCCRREKTITGKTFYIIELSGVIFDYGEEVIRSIIAHELIHTCPGCFDHGKKWKYYAGVAGEKLGYEVTRLADGKKLGLGETGAEQTRYTVTCPGCGQVFERKRMCPLIKNPEMYRCGKCGRSLSGAAVNTISCR